MKPPASPKNTNAEKVTQLTEKNTACGFHRAKATGGLQCGEVALERLAARYGTPLYVYSAGQIMERSRLFTRALSGRGHLVCYAVKENPNLGILKLLAKAGAGFDIVSGGELARVLAAAPEAAGRVVFSGVGKTAAEIDAALDAGILQFNVESEGELELLAARAKSKRKRARFALRVNPDVFAETHPYISTGLREHKFGIEIEKAREIYRRAARMKWVEAQGISVHIGSQIRQAKPFGDAVRRVVSLAEELRREGILLRLIDAGGGLGIDYHRGKFNAAAKANEYARELKRALGGFKGKLLIEPGRFIVAQAGALLARVLYVKKNGRKSFVILDAAMNDLIRPALYQAYHEIVPVFPRKGRAMTADIVGPVCETGDFFARDRRIAPVEPGDLVAILDAGAYGMSQASNYNSRPRAAEVMFAGKTVKVVRRRETVEELFQQEV